jgi:hypothetical protein
VDTDALETHAASIFMVKVCRVIWADCKGGVTQTQRRGEDGVQSRLIGTALKMETACRYYRVLTMVYNT